MLRFFAFISFFAAGLLAENSLECKVVNEDDIYKIKCKYQTVSKSYDRNISMAWTSPSTPQDDRFKTILLKAYHKSAYDFRYFDGRAEGSWTISATDDSTGQVTTIQFEKQELSKTLSMPESCEDAKAKKP